VIYHHGGNIYKAASDMGVFIQKILDFSASINPLGMPESAVRAYKYAQAMIPNYPDPDCTQLADAVSGHYGIDDKMLVFGNGSTELIYLTVRTIKPKRVLIPNPTFNEYERAVRLYGFQHPEHIPDNYFNFMMLDAGDGFVMDIDEFISNMTGCDMAFICNPNNPTGRVIKKNEMLRITEAARTAGCLLIVDEAFIDYCPEHSVMNEVASNPFVAVLRSLTKYYAMAGLRLGFGVYSEQLIKNIKACKEPWTVNSVAQACGAAALTDSGYRKATKEALKRQRAVLEDGFNWLEIKYIPSDANYYLVKMFDARRAAYELRKKGILVRTCGDFRGLDSSYIRIAVKSAKDNLRLVEELSVICGTWS
jgi:threonine-phosphate decarboxylase